MRDFDQALAAKPGDAELLNNRGVALYRLDHVAEARAAYDAALATEPGHVESLLNRAMLLQAIGSLDEALADYEKAVPLAPANARAFNGRGSVLHALKRERDALADFESALALEPRICRCTGQPRPSAPGRKPGSNDHAGATADLAAALAANPDQPYARGELLHLKMFAGDWQDFDNLKALADEGVRAGKPVVRPFVYQAVSASPADLQACSRIFAQRLFPPLDTQPIVPRSHDKIRIGYVSAEFREQATAYLMAGLYEKHDRSRFEIIAIDNGGGDGSPMRRRLEAAFDKILYINQMPDAGGGGAHPGRRSTPLVNLAPAISALPAWASSPSGLRRFRYYLGFPATPGRALHGLHHRRSRGDPGRRTALL